MPLYDDDDGELKSLPLRGAWIEIVAEAHSLAMLLSLPLRGAWIEMQTTVLITISVLRRSPCGGRGLKLQDAAQNHSEEYVAPLAGGVD